jgi:hypothetical protein
VVVVDGPAAAVAPTAGEAARPDEGTNASGCTENFGRAPVFSTCVSIVIGEASPGWSGAPLTFVADSTANEPIVEMLASTGTSAACQPGGSGWASRVAAGPRTTTRPATWLMRTESSGATEIRASPALV